MVNVHIRAEKRKHAYARACRRGTAKQPETQVLLLGGKPLDEPIAAEGPFVMNSRSEIMQARMDYQNGKMGR